MTNGKYAVAVVGMGCRLPGGIENPESLAAFLHARGDGIRLVPATRWSVEEHFDPDPKTPGKTYVKHGGFLTQDVFAFDPTPFGISPREADRLDPQQRLLLEVTWEAFEDAGIAIDSLRGSDTAVFIGGFTQDHQLIALGDKNRQLIDSHTSVGASMTVLSNRISYTFDWHGASMTIDTACSSSLVALHLASEEVAYGRSSVALAGGVNVMLSPNTTIAMCKGQFLAPDGRSKSFDARADGYGRGEGAGIVVLKRLDLAQRDGDHIYAVVCATGVNQDGRTDGMPMPNGDAQQKLASAVLARSGLSTRDVAYVEAHGTGTRAGDPVEVRALGAAYGHDRETPLLVGSIKSNIGHLEAAAGVTGLIKAVLSVSRREIFPLRELGEPNPAIAFRELNVELALASSAWPTAERACAAVNSFGYGGTNAHAILGEYRPSGSSTEQTDDTTRGAAAPGVTAGLRLVPLTAACRQALLARAADVAELVTPDSWEAVARTFARKRAQLQERAVILAEDADVLARELQKLAKDEVSDRVVVGTAATERRLLWVFTGMGPQWADMGKELFESEPVFRSAVEAADTAFHAAAGWSVLEEMLRPAPESKMKSNYVAQPANFVLQVGLVALLRSLGVPEHGMLGHSVGELAAAWASGCLSLAEAARIACHRSRLQQKLAGLGGMLAVGATEEELASLLEAVPGLCIAAYNGPKSHTLAGRESTLVQAASLLKAQGTFHRRVPVEVAYHSPDLEPLRPEFMAALGDVNFEAPQVPLYSTADGVRVAEAVHDAEYWWRNAREPVLLRRALDAAINDGYDAFIEIGPHPVLGGAVREVLSHHRRDGHVAFSMRRSTPERLTLRRAVAELFVNGTSVDWKRLLGDGAYAPLPAYRFQRRTHWVESVDSLESRLGRSRAQPLLAQRDGGPSPRYSTGLTRPSLSYLHDHRIEGRVVFPAAGYVDAALSACREVEPASAGYVLEDVRFEQVFILRPEASPALIVDAPGGERPIILFGRHQEEAWEQKAQCRLVATAPDPEEYLELPALRAELPIELDVQHLYDELTELGLEYGPAFRRLESVRVRLEVGGGGTLLARLKQPEGLEGGTVHPTALDAAFHALLSLATEATSPVVPTGIDRLCWWNASQMPVWVHGSVSVLRDGSLTGQLKLADESGRVLLDARGLTLRPLHGAEAPPKYASWLHTDGFQALSEPLERASDARAFVLVGSAESFLERLQGELQAAGSEVRLTRTLVPADLEGGARLVVAIAGIHSEDGGLRAVTELFDLVQKLEGLNTSLTLVTFSAHALARNESPSPAQAALWGFARVVMTERPELALHLIDVAANDDPSALVSALGAEEAEEAEEELALRGGQRFGRRLRRADWPAPSPRGSTLHALPSWQHVRHAAGPGRELGFGEVEIRALTAAVHPADLTQALRPAALGAAQRGSTRGRAVCGKVIRTGPGVHRVAVGDLVQTFQTGDVTIHVRVPEARAVRVAPECSPASVVACELHVAARHALVDIARIAPGDAVLVHDTGTAAALACADVARLLGARVFGVVERPERRQDLLAHGAAHALLLGGEATEARLRALAPDGLRAILSAAGDPERELPFELLAVGGHFICLSPSEGGAGASFQDAPEGVSVTRLSLSRLATESPSSYATSARFVLDHLARGELTVAVAETFPADAAAAAFERLSGGDTAAPLVLDFSADGSTQEGPASQVSAFRKDRSYLVTGGLAGFGLVVAEWMAREGAGTLVLASRRGTLDAEAAAVVERMRHLGARVVPAQLDVSDEASLAALLARVRSDLPTLGGVFHAATVLADGPLATVTHASLALAMTAKARGAWLLHEQTKPDPLEHFVVFSSVSALVGNPNQAGYAAANAYLDGLASLRRADGLPALSVSFGAIKDAGIVARDAATRAHLATLGIHPMPSRLVLAALRGVLRSSEPHWGIVDMDWNRWAASFTDTPWQRLSELLELSAPGEDAAHSLKTELSTLEPAARRERVVARVRDATATVLRLPSEGVEPASSLRNYGLDSLMAVELQVALEKATGYAVPTIEILAGASVNDMAGLLLARLEAAPEKPAHSRKPAAKTSTVRVPRPLRERLLEQICVQPPYFALDDFAHRGEWLEAVAHPLAPRANEDGVVSCAEAARHLAIAGSCALSLVSPVAGRVYYPVERAVYVTGPSAPAATGRAPLDTVVVRARSLEFDVKASKARAETQLCDSSGAVLHSLVVDYHVIPEHHFRELFAAHARPTAEAEGFDPYGAWQQLPAPVEADGWFELDLGAVDPTDCLGHFVGFPALPVSIMTRHAVDLVARVRHQEHGTAPAPIVIAGGVAETQAFVFAGQHARLRARALGASSGGLEQWRCEVLGDGRLAASFEFQVGVGQARTSGIYFAATRAEPAKRRAG